MTDIENGSGSKSAGIGSESSSARHGVAAAISVAVKSIITDPGEIDLLTEHTVQLI